MLLIGFIISSAVIIHLKEGYEDNLIEYLTCLNEVYGSDRCPSVTIIYSGSKEQNLKTQNEEHELMQGNISIEKPWPDMNKFMDDKKNTLLKTIPKNDMQVINSLLIISFKRI